MPEYVIDQDFVLQCLINLVSIDSTNPSLVPEGAGEKHCTEYLARVCTKLGLEVTIQEVAGPERLNLIARWRGSGGGRSLLLTGHTDVVGSENMTIPPFEPEVRDGKLYGRGAYDMKGGLASILGAVKALKDAGFDPAGDLILAFVADEEHASLGTQALLPEIDAQAAVLVEPTGMDICIAHRGFVWLEINTRGRAEHGSLYDLGVDAIAHMGPVLAAIQDMELNYFPRKTHPLLGRASVHASLIEGGLELSTYPDRCSLKIEHRTLPGESAQDVLALWTSQLEDITNHHTGFQAEIKLLLERPAFEISPSAPIVTALGEKNQLVTGAKPVQRGILAWLDSAFLEGAGIDTAIFGPGGEGAHAAVEYVFLDDVITCSEVLAHTSANWVGG